MDSFDHFIERIIKVRNSSIIDYTDLISSIIVHEKHYKEIICLLPGDIWDDYLLSKNDWSILLELLKIRTS